MADNVGITMCFQSRSKNECSHIKQAVKSLIFPLDSSLEIIQIIKSESNECTVSCEQTDGKLVTPAIAIMVFARETGLGNADELRQEFLKAPWSLHHSVKLQRKALPGQTVAQQNFYQLSQDLPLWSVCPTIVGQEFLRINIFVINFHKMVEFYRLITNVEMESSKAGFCFFQLNSFSTRNVRLSLKHCPALLPKQLSRVRLNFRVNSVKALQVMITSGIKKVTQFEYRVLDPDGNIVHLIETRPVTGNHGNIVHLTETRPVCGNHVSLDRIQSSVKPAFDGTSLQSNSDSQDSGLFSDSEQGRSVNVTIDTQIDEAPCCDCVSVDRLAVAESSRIPEISTPSSSTAMLIHKTSEPQSCCSSIYNIGSLSSVYLQCEESDFEDPWGGSQYNESVNPSREYKIAVVDKRTNLSDMHRRLSKKVNGQIEVVDSDIQAESNQTSLTNVGEGNGQKTFEANHWDKCKTGKLSTKRSVARNDVCVEVVNCGINRVVGKQGKRRSTHSSESNPRREPSVPDNKSSEVSQKDIIRGFVKLGSSSNTNNMTQSLDRLSISSEQFHILPDEGYHDAINKGLDHNVLSRSTSCDISSLQSFRQSRSILKFISDKLLSKEKKFQVGNFKSLKCVNQDCENILKTNDEEIIAKLWFRNPKLFQILGPPHTSPQAENVPAANVIGRPKLTNIATESSKSWLDYRKQHSDNNSVNKTTPLRFDKYSNQSDTFTDIVSFPKYATNCMIFPQFQAHYSQRHFIEQTGHRGEIGTLVCLPS